MLWHFLNLAISLSPTANIVKPFSSIKYVLRHKGHQEPYQKRRKRQLYMDVPFLQKIEHINSSKFRAKQLQIRNIKKSQRQVKSVKTRITPPIILFVIDNSGSMYQSIFYNMKYGSNPNIISQAKKSLSTAILEIIVNSTLYKQEREAMSKLQSNYTNLVKNVKYSEEEISKIVLLYAVIEHSLKLIMKKAEKIDYRVGFIFFSDMIYVLKGAKQK